MHTMRHDARLALRAPQSMLLRVSLAIAVGLPVALGVATAPPRVAQLVTPGPDAPTFEVASVKPNNTPGRRGGRGMPGRISLVGMPVKQLIRGAYGIHPSQIVGGPDWLDGQTFDIEATTGGAPPDQNRFMMQ